MDADKFSEERKRQLHWLAFSNIPGFDPVEDEDEKDSDWLYTYNRENEHYLTLCFLMRDEAFFNSLVSALTEENQHKRFQYHIAGTFAGNEYITNQFGAKRKVPTNNIDIVFDMSEEMLKSADGQIPENGWLTDADWENDLDLGELKGFAPYTEALDYCQSVMNGFRRDVIRKLRPCFPNLQKKVDQLFLELIDFKVTQTFHKKTKASSMHIGFEILEPVSDVVFVWNFLNLHIDWRSACKGQVVETELMQTDLLPNHDLRYVKPMPYRQDLLTVYDRKKVTRRRLMALYFDYANERKKIGAKPEDEDEIDQYIEYLKLQETEIDDDEPLDRFVSIAPKQENEEGGTSSQLELEEEDSAESKQEESYLRWSLVKRKAQEIFEKAQELIMGKDIEE